MFVSSAAMEEASHQRARPPKRKPAKKHHTPSCCRRGATQEGSSDDSNRAKRGFHQQKAIKMRATLFSNPDHLQFLLGATTQPAIKISFSQTILQPSYIFKWSLFQDSKNWRESKITQEEPKPQPSNHPHQWDASSLQAFNASRRPWKGMSGSCLEAWKLQRSLKKPTVKGRCWLKG